MRGNRLTRGKRKAIERARRKQRNLAPPRAIARARRKQRNLAPPRPRASLYSPLRPLWL